jgi:hypothetical protein
MRVLLYGAVLHVHTGCYEEERRTLDKGVYQRGESTC